MALWTRADLRRRARARADMVNSQFISDIEWNDLIQESCTELYDLLVAENQDYFTTLAFPTVATDSNDFLIQGLYKLTGVDRSLSGNPNDDCWVSVRPYQFSQRNAISGVPGRRHSPVRYRLFGSSITLLPAELAPGLYRIWYVPELPSFADDSDTFDGHNGWDQYVVVDAATKALTKEESDTSSLDKEKLGVWNRIKVMAPQRDYSEPERIVDVRNCDEEC